MLVVTWQNLWVPQTSECSPCKTELGTKCPFSQLFRFLASNLAQTANWVTLSRCASVKSDFEFDAFGVLGGYGIGNHDGCTIFSLSANADRTVARNTLKLDG